MFRSSFRSVLALECVGVALTVLAASALAQVPKPDPSQGDGRVSSFYTWSASLPSKPGRLLRTEELPAELGLAQASSQQRILYTSTDGVTDKGIVAVSGALFLPRGERPKGGWPIIAWAHGTTGLADICAPSWAQRSYRDVRYLNSWLSQGYAVVATDYQGLGVPGPHPYLQARPEAYSTLDSVRAALGSNHDLANKVVVVGQSQGGGAAFATSAFAPAYAPDINIVGTVATGVPYFGAPVTAQIHKKPDEVDPNIAIVFFLALMVKQSNPQLDLDTVFGPAARPMAELAKTSCVYALEHDVELERLTAATALTPAVQTMLMSVYKSLLYPTLKLNAPLFVGTGELDDEAAPQAQRALVKDACAAGTTVEAHWYPGESHESTVNRSLQDSEPFVRKVFAGEQPASSCANLSQ